MNEIDFEPCYTFKSLFMTDVMLINGLLLILALIIFLIYHNTLWGLIEVLFLLNGVIGLASILIRKVEFKPLSFTVRYFLWPSKTIAYSDVTGLGLFSIRTRKGIINPFGMSNWYELIVRFRALVEDDKIPSKQLNNRQIAEEMIRHKSWIYSLLISLPFWALVGWYHIKYHLSEIVLILAVFMILLLIELIVTWVLKKRVIGSIFKNN